MSDRMPPSPPRPPKFPGSGRPESPNWGVWVMVLLIVGVLAFGFFTPESFGLGPRKENLESFEAQYKAGRVVLNDPKAPVEVVLSENGSEGVIHALVYRKEIQPKVEMTPFALTYSMSLPDRDKPLLNELSGYRVVESPYRTEEGKNVSLIPEGAQKLSVPEFNRLALEGRIAGGKDGIILAEDGNQNVLVGQIVTRIWPAATGDASVDKQRFERVEVPFTLEFQGDRVKQLLGPDTKFKRESGSWGGILLNLLPIVLILVILFFMFRAQSGGARGAMSFGKSRARLISPDKNKVTFKDVAGISEAKEEVWELVEFLRNPEKFRDLGATIPRGVLMVGAPGTGKTLLARAIAGESNASFYSISGSDFVEMFVGVGASRVRDMFEQAKRTAPSLIFIDEIDAVGRQRGYGMGGGNDEREQTLNALLVEMDGFENNSNVIVIAATNRADILDPALLRPGRFDRRITIDRPNLAGRLATLQVHTRNIRLAEDVNLEKIAQATAGCVGADLANLVNEAALRAVRKGRRAVNQDDLLVSFELVIAGSEKKGTVITEAEKRIIAYHEVGHALVAAKQKNAQPVSKITIVPHTQGTLGYTLHLPEEEKFLMSREDILTEIRTLLAGRSSEEVVCNTMTSGAANDIERATEMARNLVARFGMCDEFDMMALGTVQSQYLDGGYSMTCAQETYAAADRATIAIIRQCHQDARKLLEENRELLDKIAAYLLKKETITGQEMMAIIEGRDPETVDNYGATREEDQKLFRPSTPDVIDPPARHINIVSQPIPMPDFDKKDEKPEGQSQDKPEDQSEHGQSKE